MPCMKCDNGKWKWGLFGECQYDNEDECKRAHKGHPHNTEDDSEDKEAEGTG